MDAKKKRMVVWVRLEPDLELRAAAWDAAECRLWAAKYRRWARQLTVKATILELHVLPQPPRLSKQSHGDFLAN